MKKLFVLAMMCSVSLLAEAREVGIYFEGNSISDATVAEDFFTKAEEVWNYDGIVDVCYEGDFIEAIDTISDDLVITIEKVLDGDVLDAVVFHPGSLEPTFVEIQPCE
ncbi:MAG: hypothetical protein H6621_11670 [Halobacteriovoraceae bacterium]|nr:hypothetical protein [Halobacteriovoraceae bacterium]MCB9095718.1 hypothetical protein [Halobacteriovoraceae bacterium]